MSIFKEAVAFLEKKVVLPYSEYKNLRIRYKALAFSVQGYTQLEILNEFYDKVTKAVENGTTLYQFREEMNEYLESKGIQGITRNRADTIFRTNVQTAYNAGHYQTMTEVKDERPYWQYMTAGDNRVREDHAEMDGKIYHCDDPIWDMWYPPNGFKCRCTVCSLTVLQVTLRKLEVESEPPYTVDEEGIQVLLLPSKSFRTNAGKTEWEPDVAAFPKALKKAYEEFMKQKNGQTS